MTIFVINSDMHSSFVSSKFVAKFTVSCDAKGGFTLEMLLKRVQSVPSFNSI